MTPEEALSQRDRLIYSLGQARRDGRFDSDQLDHYIKCAVTARVVIWKGEIHIAATSGCQSLRETKKPAGVLEEPTIFFFDAPQRSRFLAGDWADKEVSGYMSAPGKGGRYEGDRFLGMMGVLEVLTFSPPREGGTPVSLWTDSWMFDQPCDDKFDWLLAQALFLDQEFVGLERQTLPRHFRRQAELKRRPPLPEINVVTLRRTHREERPTGYRGEPRDYDHSWLRSAHWRKQLCRTRDAAGEKTRDGAWEVRPVYVRACVCGPEDKPLRTPNGTIYAVRR